MQLEIVLSPISSETIIWVMLSIKWFYLWALRDLIVKKYVYTYSEVDNHAIMYIFIVLTWQQLCVLSFKWTKASDVLLESKD